MTLLDVTDLSAGYDSRRSVIRDVELRVNQGEFVTVLGANGAGKTTLIRALMGLCRLQHGSISFRDEILSSSSTKHRVSAGLAVVPQGQELFTTLSVEENLEAGGLIRKKTEVSEEISRMYEIFPKLLERRKQRVSTLSGGERALVAIARSLVSAPSLLILDEPSLGLSPGARPGVFSHLKQLVQSTNLAVLMAEQDAVGALKVADRCYGMKGGQVIGWLDADKVTPERLEKLYLGTAEQWNVAVTNR
jgi:branched-chain amino acid transport system ATP-binding protein